MKKKERIFILTAMGLVALLLTGGLFVAAAGNNHSAIVSFEGSRVRTLQVPGPQEIHGCRLMGANQMAWWTVTTDNDLVTGEWYNYETKTNREVIQYKVDGVLVDCIASDPPDTVTPGPDLVLGVGVVHGPFTLTPDVDVGGGFWEGIWRIEFRPDGTAFQTVTAQGIGGDLEGLTLKISDKFELPAASVPFNGFIVCPPGKDK